MPYVKLVKFSTSNASSFHSYHMTSNWKNTAVTFKIDKIKIDPICNCLVWRQLKNHCISPVCVPWNMRVDEIYSSLLVGRRSKRHICLMLLSNGHKETLNQSLLIAEDMNMWSSACAIQPWCRSTQVLTADLLYKCGLGMSDIQYSPCGAQ